MSENSTSNSIKALEKELVLIQKEKNKDLLAEIKISNKLAAKLTLYDHQRASRLLANVKAMLNDCPNKIEQAKYLLTTAEILVRKGDHQKGLDLATEAKALLKGEPLDQVPHLALILGRAHWRLGNLVQALDCFQQQYKISLRLNDKILAAKSLNDLGIVKANSGNLEDAHRSFLEALDLYEKTDDLSGQAVTLNNLSMTVQEWGDYKKALAYANSALDLAKKSESVFYQLYTLDTLSLIYLKKSEYPLALEYTQQSIDLARSEGIQNDLGISLLRKGRIYHLVQDAEKAIVYLNQALEIFQHQEQKNDLPECHKLLAEIYESKGDLKKALQHYKQFHEISEILFNENIYKKISNLRIQHEAETVAKAYIENIIKSMVDGLIVIDPDGTIATLNQAATEILGYSDEELLGKPSSLLQIEQNNQREKLNIDTFIQKDVIQAIELDFIKKNEQVVPVLFSSSVMRNTEHEIQGVICTIKDISRQKENEKKHQILEEKLRQANKMESLGTLAGGIAHDFNTLLGTIVGYTNIIANDISKDSPIQEDLKAIAKVSGRAKEMINQILDFSNPRMVETDAVDFIIVVKSSIDLVRKTIPKTVVIEEKYPLNPVKIVANESQINQVLLNLCTNAVDFMENNIGTISIAVKEQDNFQPRSDMSPGRFLNIRISDTGVGIDQELLEKIFEPYYTSKATGKGSGLGLAVVYNVIHNHGGFVSVGSEVGKGTHFDIYLPIQT